LSTVFCHERVELLREVQQDRTGLEHAGGRVRGAVEQARYLRVRVDLDEAAAELITLADVDEPRVVFRVPDAEREKLLEQDRDLHAVGCSQGVELQRVFADGQVLVVGRSGDGPVNAGEAASAFGVPSPDFRRYVRGRVTHSIVLG